MVTTVYEDYLKAIEDGIITPSEVASTIWDVSTSLAQGAIVNAFIVSVVLASLTILIKEAESD